MQYDNYCTRIMNPVTGACTFVFSDSSYTRAVAQEAAQAVADLLGEDMLIENLEDIEDGPTVDSIG